MPVGDFEVKCLTLIEEVRKTGVEIVITKRGKPVARLIPVAEQTREVFGHQKGCIDVLGDIVAPVDVEWDAEK